MNYQSDRSTSQKLSSTLELAATGATLIAALLVSAWVVGQFLQDRGAPQGLQPPSEPIPLELAELRGSPKAPAVILIFSDFECPFCGEFGRTSMPRIYTELVETGKAKVAFVHFPLESIHKRAFRAAEAATCAGDQGLFWPMHDLLFTKDGSLADETILAYASDLGADLGQFGSCMAGDAADQVAESVLLARRIGLNGTPTFIIGRQEGGAVRAEKIVAGAGAYDQIAAAVEGLQTVAQLGLGDVRSNALHLSARAGAWTTPANRFISRLE